MAGRAGTSRRSARVFGDFEYNWRDYDGTVIPDSDGWRALAGVEMEITQLVAGEISVGYMEQTYDQFIGPVDHHVGLDLPRRPGLEPDTTDDRQSGCGPHHRGQHAGH